MGASRIDQAVHGYDRGHRLLAASRPLDDAADDMMGSMSDLLTTRLLEDDGSYLIGYPLKPQNAYVIARTWAAREMPRPGSVWTHSLVVDYQTLALLEDPCRLLGLLRRPSGRALSEFSKPISLPDWDQVGPLPLSPTRVRTALLSVYSAEAARVIALTAGTREEDEQLVMALWRQMWPALRRDTAFFSFVDEAPLVDASCVIHFDANRSTAVTISQRHKIDAVDVLARDLPERSQTSLRAFLARHAFDAAEPRAAVLPLVGLWEVLKGGDAVAILSALAGALPHANPNRLLRTGLEHVVKGGASSSTFVDVLERFGKLPVAGRLEWLAASPFQRDVTDVGVLLDSSAPFPIGTLGSAIFEGLASTAPVETLAAAPCRGETADRLLKIRPDLLEEASYWARQKETQPALIQRAFEGGTAYERVLPLVRTTSSAEVVKAMFVCWPENVAQTAKAIADSPSGAPAVGVALGEMWGLLESALMRGDPFDLAIVDDAAGHAFRADKVAASAQPFWGHILGPNNGQSYANISVLAIASALLEGGNRGRLTTAKLLPVVSDMLARGRISSDARRYLEGVLASFGIFRWSMREALNEATVAVFTEGQHVSPLLLDLAPVSEVEGILQAIWSRLGMAEVREIRSRTIRAGSRSEAKLKQVDDFIRRRESRWFW